MNGLLDYFIVVVHVLFTGLFDGGGLNMLCSKPLDMVLNDI